MPLALIGCGSNLGDRRGQIDAALVLLGQCQGVRVERCSDFLETAPVGGPSDQPPYLNCAAVLKTSRSAEEVWEALADTEQQLGRTRDTRWGPRTMDLDLLLVGREVVRTAQLTVPHPWLAIRRFVLEPAAQIAPRMRHPLIGWTLKRLFDHLNAAPPVLVVLGANAAARTRLADRLGENSRGWRVEHRAGADRSGAKLTLLLDAPTAAGRQLKAAVEQPGWGPWLTLDNRDSSRSVADAQAALVAMA